MERLVHWWNNPLPKPVKFVLLVLLANALPAFAILMVLPDRTDMLFVWTIRPELNARLIGVMYGNALLLIAIGMFQTRWAQVRVLLVVITLFAVLVTVMTFFFLTPFLAHPWFHLAYWLLMYLVLFVAAPVVFVRFERLEGGRLPVERPLGLPARLFAGACVLVGAAVGVGLIVRAAPVVRLWPWDLPPLVGALIGVLFVTHAAAYAWVLWDGDWVRARPLFWQAPVTGVMFLLLPLVHGGQVRPDSATSLGLYLLVAGAVVAVATSIVLGRRGAARGRRARTT